MKYEVPVVYKGMLSYIVEANSPEEAQVAAEKAWCCGNNPTDVGTEWEEIERIGEPMLIPEGTE
jgi:hypothetical protein